MFYPRNLEKHLKKLKKGFPVLAVLGPRQSGKTTLVRRLFPDFHYLSLENLDTRNFAIEDPRRFLSQFNEKVIFDEIQRAPALFSYLQEKIDEKPNQGGRFVLTGSQNYLLMESVSQSLAGRVGLSYLYPFSLNETPIILTLDEQIVRGGYPPLYVRELEANDWYRSYLETYLERDVRSLKQVHDLVLFDKFLRLCAARAGQLLNRSGLGNELGISHSTVSAWLSLLETSHIIFFLQPYFKNIGKRLVKQAKLYFCDTGLLCHLLGIPNAAGLSTHYLRGSIFENFIIADIFKQFHHAGSRPSLFFWRDHRGNEVDLLIEHGNRLIPVEIKSGETLNDDFLKGLRYFDHLHKGKMQEGVLMYGGALKQARESIKILPWTELRKVDFLMTLLGPVQNSSKALK